jgi:ADP-heptose:LPS heptosyltransferase
MPKIAKTTPRRVAVFRALHLGDVLCVVPALRALSNAWPHAEFTLIGLPWAQDLAARFGYIDDFLAFPGAVGLSEREPDGAALPSFFSEARRRRFDVAFQMQGSGEKANAIVAALGARRVVGFHPSREVHTERQILLSWQARENEVSRYLRLVSAAGVNPVGEHLEFPIHPYERDELAAASGGGALSQRQYVCVNPGARWLSRRWAVERFAAVADELATLGYAIVLTGSSDEVPLAHVLERHLSHAALNLAGRLSLGAYAALLEGARLVVCNDTGTAQIAAAVKTPSVVVCSGLDPVRRQMRDAARHAVLWHDVPCRPCTHAVCPTGHECARGVAADTVLAHARQLLESGTARAA